MRYYLVSIISQRLGNLYTYESLEEIELFSLVQVTFNHRIKKALIIKETQKPTDFECNLIEEITSLYLPKKNFEIAEFIAKYYVCTLSQALGIFYFFDSKYDNLDSKELQLGDEPILSDIQSSAVDFCKQNPVALLFGDTGSGKSEIYIKAIFESLRDNKSIILLMPEISLTPQMESRLKKYFNNYIAIWHSKLNKKKRNEILEKVEKGEIKIIAGARSALFLPIRNLGLIVVDEEHDDAYKAMSEPMYNARDMAIYFGKVFDIHVILGSATPSIGSYNKYPHFRIKGSHFNSKKEFIFTKNFIDENQFILDEIKKTYERKEQTIVFVPIKANFQYLICKSCSDVMLCPYCSISLSLYSNKNALICHYCNYTQRIPNHCTSCKTGELSSKKMGTSEVIKRLSAYLPDANIGQFDKNEITTDTKLRAILKKFNEGDIDILVGTQMISKGHDYHNVALAVILNIDSILHIQDYRSREKSLSLFLQIAGRSGRKNDGKIILQTSNKDFFDMYKNDYETFLQDELIYRKNLYPPYKRLARISFSDKNKDRAYMQMQEMLKLLSNTKDIETVGYGPSPIYKIASKFRYYIFLRADLMSVLIKYIHKYKTSKASIDIDPINFA